MLPPYLQVDQLMTQGVSDYSAYLIACLID